MVTNVTREFLLIIQDKIGVKNNTITRLISISSMIFFIQLSIWASIIRGCILGREFLIEGSKLNLQGQGDYKNKRVGWKGSLAEAIVPIGGM